MTTSEFVCGTGSWTGPKPGDPDNNIVLNATGTFGGIDVFWSYPTTNPHAVAHVVVYRGLTNDMGTSVERAIVSGNYFFDKWEGEAPQTYYYWIQVVSVNGTYSAAVGPAMATARPRIEETIAQLSGKINQGALAQELRSEINNIGLLGNSISGEIRDRIAANQALSAALGEVQGEVNTAVTLIENEVNERVSANDALLTSLNLMGVGFNNSVAGLTDEVELLANETDALARKVTTVEASVNGDTATGQVGLTAKVNAVTGAIQSMYTAKVGVNGLIGGFGLYNDGTIVEAGFDVDRFWIGKDSRRIKPFIVENDEVFINKAVIQRLTADDIDTRGLAIRDANGSIIFSAGTPLASNFVTPNAGWLNSNISSGQNLIPNSDWASSITVTGEWNPHGAVIDHYLRYASEAWSDTYVLKGSSTRNVYLHQAGKTGQGDSSVAIDVYPTGGWGNSIPVSVGKRYCFSYYGASHRCNFGMYWEFRDAFENVISSYQDAQSATEGRADRLAEYKRSFAIGVAPANAATARLAIRKFNTYSTQEDSWFWFAAPQFEVVGDSATGPGPYNAGPATNTRQLGYSGDLGANNTFVSNGQLQGVSSGAGTAVANNYIGINSSGELYGAGAGNGVKISNNQIYLDGAGALQGIGGGVGQSVANNSDSVIRAPGGGVLTSTNGAAAGRIKIRLPQGFTNTMMRFTVEIYEYAENYACTLEIAGYNYSGDSRWYNVTARVQGASNVEYPVFFGHDGERCCVWIGATTQEYWSYPQVRIRDFFAGYSNYERWRWEAGWGISFDQTSIAPGTGTNQYSNFVLDTLPGVNWAKIGGDNRPADGANKTYVDGSGIIQGVAAGAGTQVANGLLVPSINAAATTASWSGVSGKPRTFTVRSYGNGYVAPPGWWNGLKDTDTDTLIMGTSRSYILVNMSREGTVYYQNTYDVYGQGQTTEGRHGYHLANDLNWISQNRKNSIIVVYTADEPLNHRLEYGLPDALYNCGASKAIFGSPNFKMHSAYILVGIAGCGEGNGAEIYAGDVNTDPDSWCELTFQLHNGALNVSGMVGSAKSVKDLDYTGDLNATVGAPNGTYVGDYPAHTVSSATEGYITQVRSFYVGGDRNTFYPVCIRTAISGGAVLYDFTLFRDQVHENENWLCSYNCNIRARSSAWGNATGTVEKVEQKSGSGNYTWAVSAIQPTWGNQGIWVWLRGGMTHKISMSQPIGTYFVDVYTGGYSDGYGSIYPRTDAPLSAYLNKGYYPDMPDAGLEGKLGKAGDTISGRISFSVTDGMFAGSDTNNGVYFGKDGLVGRKWGSNTFYINTAGDAVFSGSIDAATMNSGRINLQHSGGWDWGYSRSYGKWWDDGQNGWVFARHADGSTFAEMRAGSNRIWMSNWNDCGIQFPGITMTNGGLTISQANVINTLQLAANAVTVSNQASGSGSSVSTTLRIPAYTTMAITALGSINSYTYFQGTYTNFYPPTFGVSIDGAGSTTGLQYAISSQGETWTDYSIYAGTSSYAKSVTNNNGYDIDITITVSGANNVYKSVTAFGFKR